MTEHCHAVPFLNEMHSSSAAYIETLEYFPGGLLVYLSESENLQADCLDHKN